MDKALSYLALARKAGRIELGEEPAGAAAQARKASLVVVAGDASENTWRRANHFVAGTDQQCVRVVFTKDQMGQAVGRTSLALAAITDPALALAFIKALEQIPADVAEALENAIKQARPANTKPRNRRKGRSRPAAK